jgi:hypothetical protein
VRGSSGGSSAIEKQRRRDWLLTAQIRRAKIPANTL